MARLQGIRGVPKRGGKAKPLSAKLSIESGPRAHSPGSRKIFSAGAQGYRLRSPFPVEVVAEATRVEASLWARCRCALEAELPEQQFNTWVRPLQAMEGAGALKLLAPNRFAVEWINEHLLPRIGELLRDER